MDITKLSIAVPPPNTSDKIAVTRLNTRFMLPFKTIQIDSSTWEKKGKIFVFNNIHVNTGTCTYFRCTCNLFIHHTNKTWFIKE